MTNTEFNLSPATINELFQNGTCLTYVPFVSSDAWSYAMDKKREFEKQTGKKAIFKSKKATMPVRAFSKGFHFFSNGVLILATLSENKIENIKKLIKLHGHEIKEIHKPENDMQCMMFDIFLHDISKEAEKRYYYKEDLIIEPLPDVKTFVKNLFADGNECLSASKNAVVNPKIRESMAFFANGRIILSQEKTDSHNIYGNTDHYDIKDYQSDFVFLERETLPHQYIEAIYQEAKKYPWHISSEDALKNIPQQEVSDEDIHKMNLYIENLIANRKCVSVTIPVRGGEISASPDIQKYALFADGKLVYANNIPPTKFLKDDFPNMLFEEEQVPEYYIENIYKKLLTVQKSANKIYIEMLKQKAKKLKKLFDIPHHKALETVANMAGISKWEKISELTEQQSRRGIYLEQSRKKIFKEKTTQELLEIEYNQFLSRK